MSDASLPTAPDDLERAVAALIDLGGHLSQMVEHMSRAPRRVLPNGAHAVPIPDVLAPLLVETLRPLESRASPGSIADAADLLRQIAAVFADEIYLVPHGAPPPRPKGGQRRRRR